MAEQGGPDWAGYYAWSAGREPQPLLVAACQELGAGQGRLAIDLGCGHGTEALELLARGWSVLAVDAAESGLAVLRARIPPLAAERIRLLCASFTAANLPPAHLIHAGFSLPFCPPQQFPAMWARIRQALVPGGVFAGQLFGIRDSWAADPAMTFHDRRQAESLLDGLQILRLQETEHDGHAFSGQKHWHIFDILARQQPPIPLPGLPATPAPSQTPVTCAAADMRAMQTTGFSCPRRDLNAKAGEISPDREIMQSGYRAPGGRLSDFRNTYMFIRLIRRSADCRPLRRIRLLAFCLSIAPRSVLQPTG